MYLGITSLPDAELQSRRCDLDRLIQINSEELRLLNREFDRREWVRHSAIQAEVAAAEAAGRAPCIPAAPASTSNQDGSATAIGEGVTVKA